MTKVRPQSISAMRKGNALMVKKRRKERKEKENEILTKCFDIDSSSKKKNYFKKLLSRKGMFNRHKKYYLDKIIDYKDSPTGKAYIGINKTPLMQNDNKIGYKGVLLQDDQRRLVQCSACGKWMKKITDLHLKKCSGMTTVIYKEEFGFSSRKGLVSDETSIKTGKAALKNKAFSKKNIKKIQGIVRTKKTNSYSIEQANRYGNCPLQLKQRLYDFIICNRELPNCGNRGTALYKAIIKRYGRFGKALKEFNLPTFKRIGTNYIFTFSDWTIKKYNINKPAERELLFDTLVSKCLDLKNQLLESTPSG